MWGQELMFKVALRASLPCSTIFHGSPFTGASSSWAHSSLSEVVSKDSSHVTLSLAVFIPLSCQVTSPLTCLASVCLRLGLSGS